MSQTQTPADRLQTYAAEAYGSERTGPSSYVDVPPRLVAGTLCLDFVNTVSRPTAELTPNERLTGYSELLFWARAAGILDDAGLKALTAAAEADPSGAAAVLAKAVALREALAALIAGSDGPPEALSVLNGLLERAPQRRRLAPNGPGFAWRVEQPGEDLERPLWQVAWDAAALLTSDRLERVRRCVAPDCGWLFLDLTRNRSRRWCSMEDCGNRAKARRHYAKRKRSGG